MRDYCTRNTEIEEAGTEIYPYSLTVVLRLADMIRLPKTPPEMIRCWRPWGTHSMKGLMSKLSGSRKRARKRKLNRQEHERIVAESKAVYRAHWLNWEQMRGPYWRIIADAMRGREDLDPTYKKQSNRPPSTLTIDELAVVLAAVDGFGEASGGISLGRVNLALGYCGVGKSRAKIVPALRLLVAVGLIEFLRRYQQGRRGNQYRLTDTCLTALNRPKRVERMNTYGKPTPLPPLPPLPKDRPRVPKAPDTSTPTDPNDSPFGTSSPTSPTEGPTNYEFPQPPDIFNIRTDGTNIKDDEE